MEYTEHRVLVNRMWQAWFRRDANHRIADASLLGPPRLEWRNLRR